MTESPEPSPAPSTPPGFPKLGVQELTDAYMMMVGFEEAIRDGSFSGRHARALALGLDFVQRTIPMYKHQLDVAKAQEKEMLKRAKAAIKDAGGDVNGKSGDASANASRNESVGG